MEQSRIKRVEYVDHTVRTSNVDLTKLGPLDVGAFAANVGAELYSYQRSCGQQICRVVGAACCCRFDISVTTADR
jgi:hypothetical protein